MWGVKDEIENINMRTAVFGRCDDRARFGQCSQVTTITACGSRGIF